ncbi:MAG TPA: hypothetical protein VJO14_01930, partial [Bacteroidota bacterium]|nr:hypothetical protein [Bacteroidota bacterium]
ALYCAFGVIASVYYVELAAVPFQLLFTMGFGLVAWTSLRHIMVGRRPALAATPDDDETPAMHPEDIPDPTHSVAV